MSRRDKSCCRRPWRGRDSPIVFPKHQYLILQLCDLLHQSSKFCLLGFIRQVRRKVSNAISRRGVRCVPQPLYHHPILKHPRCSCSGVCGCLAFLDLLRCSIRRRWIISSFAFLLRPARACRTLRRAASSATRHTVNRAGRSAIDGAP